jgi:transcription initiation factor IIE alpha subunit
MTRSKTQHTRREKQAPISTRSHDKTVAPSRPGGKLGLIVDRLAAKAGATASELAEATGWQKHTVRGALSRLRTRGFAMRLEVEEDRKAYRLERAEG